MFFLDDQMMISTFQHSAQCSSKLIHHALYYSQSYRLYKGAGTLTLPLLPARSAAFPPAEASEYQKLLLPRSMALANASHGHLIKPPSPEGHTA